MDEQTQTNAMQKKDSMKKRTITGAIYLVVWIVLCALKWCVPHTNLITSGSEVYWGALGFDAAFCAVSVLGCLEFLRAMGKPDAAGKGGLSTPQRAVTIAFCAVCVPLYVLVEILMRQGFLAVACAFAVYFMLLAATSVFDHGRSTVKGTVTCVFCMIYCGLLSTLLSAVNHLEKNSMAAILVLFLCTVLTDTGAFAIGSTLKRFVPLKLAPALSPNKTVIGAVGGIIGGILGGVIAYVLIHYLGGFNGIELDYSSKIPAIVAFILIGLFTAVLAQIGDLFESAVKRECGIKDMGDLLPGHGGILDRFDSMLYCGIAVLFAVAVLMV